MSWADHPHSERSDRISRPDAEASDGETDRTGSETAVLELLREGSRAVVSEQIALLWEIDEKAMRTVRTAVLVVGLVVSASRIGGSKLGSPALRLGIAGSAFLVVSVVVGTYTYAVSNVDLGVSADHRSEVLRESYTEREWLRFQLREYDEWTAELSARSRTNARLLHVTLVSLVAGIVALLGAVVTTPSVPVGATGAASGFGGFRGGLSRSFITLEVEVRDMGRSPKSGRELDPERGYKGPKYVRDFHEWLVARLDTDDS